MVVVVGKTRVQEVRGSLVDEEASSMNRKTTQCPILCQPPLSSVSLVRANNLLPRLPKLQVKLDINRRQ